jgi:hypothetical protein
VPRKEIALQYIHIERHQYKEKKKYGFGEEIRLPLFEL